MSGNTDDTQPISFGFNSGSGSSDFTLTSTLNTFPSPAPPPSLTPSLPLSSPTSSVNSTTVMPVFPMIYLIAVPLAIGVLLSILLLLICSIVIYYRLRKKRSRRRGQNLKHTRNCRRTDHSKSLEGYTGNEHSSNSMANSEVTTTRYELQTRDGRRISSNSASSPTAQYSSKTLPATTKLHLASGSNNTLHSPSMDAIYPHTSHKPSLLHAHSASPPHHMMPSARQDDIFRLQGIPEHHTQGQGVHTSHCVVSSRAGSLPYSSTSDGFNTDMIPDPTSLYDVPSNALLVGSSPVNMPSSPQSSHLLYDVPKDVLIATGHYKVPSLSLNDPNTPLTPEGVYDVPSSAIYDMPPDVYHHYYNQQDLYDVPPNSIITRPRLNSQPTSQKELFEARRSITDNPSGPDNVFTTTADVVRDYSHYDVPRSLVMIEDGNISQPSQQQGELDQFGKRLSRRNSIPIHAMLYDVPRNALLADNEAMNLSRLPTAPKPTRGRKISRSHSISSTHDYRSPEHTKPHKNAAFYKVAPLDPELLTKHKKESTSGEQEAAHMRSHHLKQHSVPTTYSNNTVKQQTHTIAVSPRRSTSFKKNKVPPPTKIKPGRGGEV